MSGCRRRRPSDFGPVAPCRAGSPAPFGLVSLALAAALAAAGCYPEDDRGPCGLTRAQWVIDGQEALLLAPPELVPDEAAPLVIYHHGRNEEWDAIESRGNLLATVCMLGAAGYLVAGSRAHGNNWGIQEAIDDYVALHATIAAERPIRDVMFLSVSMGGLSGLLTLAQRAIPGVRAWAGIAPVTNLGYFYFEDESIHGQIVQAHGGPPAPGQDPMMLDPAVFRGVPMLMWASYEDATVPREENADMLLERLGYPPEVRVIDIDGAHGRFDEEVAFRPDEVVAFFDAHRSE